MKERILKAIYASIDEVNSSAPEEEQLSKTEDTILFGPDGKLDSLGLVTFIVTVESKVEEEFGEQITLANETALSQEDSPFATVSVLADYVEQLLKEVSDG